MNDNELLAPFRKLPGKVLELPSKHIISTLYDASIVTEQTLSTGAIHLRPMSTEDELDVKTPDLLLSGRSIPNVIRRCTSDILQPEALCVADINAILVALRIISYGDQITVVVGNKYYDANNTNSQANLTYNLSLTQCLGQSKPLPTTSLVLDVGEGVTQTVVLRPPRYSDSISILNKALVDVRRTLNTDEERAKYITEKMQDNKGLLLSVICSVNGITNKQQIQEWFEILPVYSYDVIKDRLKELGEAGPDLVFTAKDPITKKEWLAKIPIDPLDFFSSVPRKAI